MGRPLASSETDPGATCPLHFSPSSTSISSLLVGNGLLADGRRARDVGFGLGGSGGGKSLGVWVSSSRRRESSISSNELRAVDKDSIFPRLTHKNRDCIALKNSEVMKPPNQSRKGSLQPTSFPHKTHSQSVVSVKAKSNEDASNLFKTEKPTCNYLKFD